MWLLDKEQKRIIEECEGFKIESQELVNKNGKTMLKLFTNKGVFYPSKEAMDSLLQLDEDPNFYE